MLLCEKVFEKTNSPPSWLGCLGILNLQFKTGKLVAKPCQFPIVQNLHLTREGELFGDPKRYRRLVGNLNYLTVTRLDIAYYVSVVSQYMSSPTVDHWAAVEHILCYFKGALRHGILYSNHVYNILECFTDVDLAEYKEDRRSTLG